MIFMQGACERRIEVFVKIQKKIGGGGGGLIGGGGFRVGANKELKFLRKFTNKKIQGGGVFGFGGGGGQGGCERRIEVLCEN